MNSQASDEATEASQSLARRRQRLSHAKVRSTIQRLGKTTNPLAPSERLTISESEALDVSESLLQFPASIAAIGKELCQRGKTHRDDPDEAGSAVAILNGGLVDDPFQHVARRIGHDVALAAP